jgi:hypothetical protein
MREIACSSAMSVPTYKTVWCRNPKDHNLTCIWEALSSNLTWSTIYAD